MTDAPDRAIPRFPENKAPAARDAVDAILRAWEVDGSVRGICGGARGGDLIFAEAMVARGASVELFLPMPVAQFLEASVRGSAGDAPRWEARFHTMHAASRVTVLGSDDARPGGNVFARNNARMIEIARTTTNAEGLAVLLLWDGRAGDGPGGTADFARMARESGATLEVIDPADF